MDIVFWPHIRNKKVASYRLRCLQIVETLQKRGLSAGFYHTRVQPKVLVLSKRYDARTLKTAISLRSKYGAKLVLDICDNHFYYDNNSNIWSDRAGLLRDAILAVDVVICSSEALANIVLQEISIKAIEVKVIGDSTELPFEPDFFTKISHPYCELELYFYKKKLRSLHIQKGRKLIWFGNHGGNNAAGGMEDILLIKDQLLAHHNFSPISLTIVSNSKSKYKDIAKQLSVPSIYVDWNYYTFSRVMFNNDIAIIPISVNPFTICKTNNRLATAIVHNLQVVATSIPSYEAFRDDVVLDDWLDGMESFMLNQENRDQGIKECKLILEQNFSLSKVVDSWQECLLAISKN
ncbi:MAG: hypothetical protein PSV17_00090 [Methylotenera sp.]|uniref:hypothetical protein n=1 Tax=Methylotenera sp. TaxID=2051956 RepID=UPI0024890927|nr:hypothetical protein [Methylotenera sp.]MDI1307814.1 hypothetical protein [Methylotenera sp.]